MNHPRKTGILTEPSDEDAVHVESIAIEPERYYALHLPNGETVLMAYRNDAVTLCTAAKAREPRTLMQVTAGRVWLAKGVES